MEFTISKQNLTQGLAATLGVIEKRNTMPILSNVLFEADGKALRMVATDLEIGVRLEVPAKVKTKGRITVPARKLFEGVKELPEADLHFTLGENNHLSYQVGKGKYEIVGLGAEEFPNLPKYEDGKFFTVESKALEEMLSRTVYAVSTDETRYNLNGVFFEQIEKGKKLRLVATDGHRLAVTDRPLEGLSGAWGERGLIVPRKAVAELRKLLEKYEKIDLSFQKNHGIAKADDTVLLMQLIDGEFPKYDQVIPKKTDREVVVSRGELISALKRVFPFADERSHLVRVEASKNGLVVEADSAGVGGAREEVPAEFSGDTLTIGFNARYLMDALNSIGTDDVKLGLIDEVNPATVVGVGEEGYLAVVMPMRI